MKSLIIGKGQVGSSLYEVIKPHHECFIKDVEDLDIDGIEVLHICIPYSDKFVKIVNDYISKYKPKLTINHSSVEIGTTDSLSGLKCYSPVRGKHPNLAGDIKVFEKFVAGTPEAVMIASDYFEKCGVKTVIYPEAHVMRTLEACKLMTNIRYGYEICFMQELERIFTAFGLSTEIFKTYEMSYNKGYEELGQSCMKRPILFGGVIGGHCVMQNADILSRQYISEMIDWMQFSNHKREVEFKKES